ncbi:MAG: 5-(carboxyamino)imidazole ribonucleotide mutase [Oscillospiraceae bacterium]|nr:5-(carboxyamino)imidazole ribonucleotide mutase [Oscillospiraceae bacterium]
MKSIGLVLGSRSDLPTAQKAIDTLKELDIPFDVQILSAHRTPGDTAEYARSARGRGLAAVIAFAGMAAHLAGAIAANTTLPVIGVPCSGPHFDGMDALLATVQMPTGIPVATVAVGGGNNAALLAAEILAVDDLELAQRLVDLRTSMAEQIQSQNRELQEQLRAGR